MLENVLSHIHCLRALNEFGDLRNIVALPKTAQSTSAA